MDALVQALRTDASGVWTLQRLALAAVVLPFGAQTAVPGGAPPTVIVLATVCALLLALGLATRIAALVSGALLVALLATGDGLALPLLGLVLSLSLAARGGGAASVDGMIVRQNDALPLEQEMTTDGLIVGRRVGEYGA